ncbi:MAG: endonuclease/exonuclease/phosphatase family protein [Phycisphaerales bacterium]|nr:endonuclease/exonuclease/phosphatase family protein [Phycisphaerales bacterium]
MVGPIFFLLSVSASPLIAQTGTFLDRPVSSDLRVVTYNVHWDSIFPDDDPNNHPFRSFDKVDEFRRVIVALNPDIMCLQEINGDRNPQDIADIFDQVLPLSGGQWQAMIGHSNVIVSRYPLSMMAEHTVPAGQRAQAMALVDLPNETYLSDIYLINEHYRCCGGVDNDPQRQQQSDAVVNWMRDARSPGEFISLPEDTPIVVLGDFNIVGGPGPLDTLLCGNISDEGTYGNDSPPDWDGTCNVDVHPMHNGAGSDDYTWRNDNSNFDPGRLDYITFSDSLIMAVHDFVLNTTLMSPSDLNAVGLQQFDVVLNPPGHFDHLPLVVDFRFAQPPIIADGDVNLDGVTDGRDIAWFAELLVTGTGDTLRIAHGDYNGSGMIDLGDVSEFVDGLLSP